ncbi:MAG: YaeQ family protein, partial [Thermoanaerobaculia bacterium]
DEGRNDRERRRGREVALALSSTVYNVSVDLSDVDRGVYESLDLRLAMHPSESAEYMATRLLAYCLEYTEGIEFTAGLSNGDEPAIVVRDLTGRTTAWIEVGMPDADRLHRASKLADRVALYTHRELRNVLGQLEGRKIHKAEEIPIYTFGRGFIEDLAARFDRRVKMSMSVTEQHLYLDVDGASLTTIIEDHRLGGAT